MTNRTHKTSKRDEIYSLMVFAILLLVSFQAIGVSSAPKRAEKGVENTSLQALIQASGPALLVAQESLDGISK